MLVMASDEINYPTDGMSCSGHGGVGNQQFPVRVPLLPYESGRAYLLKAAEHLGFNSIRHLLRFAGISWGDLYEPEVVKTLCHLLRLDNPEALQQQLFVRCVGQEGPASVLFLGHVIPVAHLNKKYPRVCPRCLAEKGVGSALWELTCVTVCPIHACKLVDHCSNCDELITWLRPGLMVCRCGHDLRRERLVPSKWYVVEYTRLIYGVFGCEVGRKRSKKVLSLPEIYQFEFSVLTSLIRLLACSENITNECVPAEPLLAGTVAKNYRSLEKVSKVLAQWPYAWIKHVALYLPRPGMLPKGVVDIRLKFVGSIFLRMQSLVPKTILPILKRPIDEFWAQLPKPFSTEEFHKLALQILLKCKEEV